jgi:LysR family transcriptional regulator, transcriptional activator of nhaA
MEWLNYNHLYYFWKVLRAGSLTRACEELRLAPPTVSAQLRSLEQQLGEKLLMKVGRRLVPTEMGQVAFRYAEEIFSLGQELMDALKQRSTNKPLRLVVGVDDVLPKEIAQELIDPALRLPTPVVLRCHESNLEALMAKLAIHEIDVVLSDSAVTPSLNIRAYNHLLGESRVVWIGTPELAKRHRLGFPKSLNGAPILLPTDDTAIRRKLDRWFDAHGVRPNLVGEFDDFALLRAFAETGVGLFPVPMVLERKFRSKYRFMRIGEADGVTAQFYAVSIERKLKNTAVIAICESARQQMFGTGSGSHRYERTAKAR